MKREGDKTGKSEKTNLRNRKKEGKKEWKEREKVKSRNLEEKETTVGDWEIEPKR